MSTSFQQPWWQQTVIYQIYPRSFYDSNGDGIGDIPGIIQRLDYLQDLGVETIWFSPFFQSPQKDFGYDISDYRSIAPEYGTMQDVEQLIDEVHRRGMKIVLDMVMNHTSDQHKWFKESKSSRNNAKSDWYIWRDGKGKNPPNNWKSIVWGLGWQYCEERNQWYFASFLPFQPDLNYQNPAVKQEMFDTVRFWLKKGVDGFRLDIFNCIIKDPQFRDNPFTLNPIPTVEQAGGNFQVRKYSINLPENFELAKELRAVVNEFGEDKAFLLGEVFGSQQTVKQYLGNRDGLHLVFLFETLHFKMKASWLKELISRFEQNFPQPFIPTWVLGNHDMYRYGKKINNDLRKARVLSLLQLTVRAVPTLYYGEEIGIINSEIPRSEAQDPLTEVFSWIPNWLLKLMPVSINRDVCRNPMQWNNGSNAGFSQGKPWVKLGPEWEKRNVETMQQDNDSIFHWYKKLLKIRKESPALHSGTLDLMEGLDKDIIAYSRKSGAQKMDVYINFSKKEKLVQLQGNTKICLKSNDEISLQNNVLKLAPLSGAILG